MGQFNRIAAAVQANNFANDTALYTAAVEDARARAPYTYFDQHIIQREDGTYAVIDEGDYNRLTVEMIERIVHTVAPQMSDECWYDDRTDLDDQEDWF